MFSRKSHSPAGNSKAADSKSHTRDTAMVSRLRRGFVITAMISLLIIVVLMIAVINIANFAQIDSSASEMLEILSQNGGAFPADAPADPSDQEQDDDSEPPASEPIGSQNTDDDDSERPGGRPQEDKTPSDTKGGDPAGDPPGRGSDRSHAPRSFPEMDINETRRIEAPFETRYFSVLLGADGSIENVNTDNIAAVEEDVAVEYALTVQYNGREKGYASSYRYLAVEQEDGGLLVIFVDCSSSISEAQQLLFASLLVGTVALVLMFILVLLFSGRAVSPVVESLDKQRRFVSDAGHELKTPITVISANVDVLEMTGVKNEWTASIRTQTRRMTDLVGNLLTLSRMEEDATPVVFQDVDFSSLVRENAASFDAVAQASGLDYNVAIQDGLHISGDASALRQLCTVLLDNSMKYSSEHGSVYVSLKEDRREGGIRGKKPPRIILEVSNTCDAIPEGNLDRLFDRFYRVDSSRTRIENRRKPRTSAAGFRSNGISEEEYYTGKIPRLDEITEAGTQTPVSAGKTILDADSSAHGEDAAASEKAPSHSAGGFGIGLSVAKAVASNHGGTIKAKADGDHLIRFIVTLPLKKDTK